VKRLLASAAATALALGGLLVATAAPASAHTPKVTATCTELSVNLTQYSGPGEKNSVTVVVDGEPVATEKFEKGFQGSYPLDGAENHTWSVTVDAHDGKNGTQYDFTKSDSTTACDAPAEEDTVQVGVYVYPKLNPQEPAAWENSGLQRIVTSLEIERPTKPSDKTWLVKPLDLDAVRKVAETIKPGVEDSELCTAWGVQQDLVDLPNGLAGLPTDVQYSKDGKHLNPFPDGTLISWEHQDLAKLFPEVSCNPTAPTPTPDQEPERTATPVVPTALTVCDAGLTDENVPAETDEFVYAYTPDGIVAVLKGTDVTFADGTAALGYVVAPDGRTALFPLADLLPADETCELIPGAIEAVCQGDVPYLGYAVDLPAGATFNGENPVTITFLHPGGGESYVVTDQPLSGTILWPGASAEEPKQWPGFVRNEDGSYTETEGNYAWTRDGVEVLFEVNPSYSTVVTYPPATTACANPPVAPVAAEDVAGAAPTSNGPQLASTGATVAGAVGFAALLVGGGALVFWLRRRVQA
jgi:hypothetical protein